MAPSNKGTILDVKLTIRYFGLKATQYFSKFTSESDKTFRDDLLALKLPHPKRENTTFLSHGCIECEWKGVQPEGVLHKQIMTRSKPLDESILQELSISNIKVKCIYPPNNQPPKVNGVKRANPYAESQATNRVPALPRPGWPANYFENASDNLLHERRWTGAISSGPPWDIGSQKRPHKQAKLNEGDISSSNPQKSPTFPTFTNLPPLPPRAERMGKTRVFVPTVPNKTARTTSEGSQTHESTFSINSTDPGEPSTLVVSKKKSSVSNDESRMPTGPMSSLRFSITPPYPYLVQRAMDYPSKTSRMLAPQGSRTSGRDKTDFHEPNIMAINSYPIKREHDDDAHSSFLQKRATPENIPSHEDPLRTPTQNNFQMTHPLAQIPEESSGENDKAKGDLLIQGFLKNLKLQNVQSSGFTTTPSVHPSLQNHTNAQPHAPHTNPLGTSTLSNPPPQTGDGRNAVSNFTDLKESLQRLDWYNNWEVPPFRGPNLDKETMPPAAPPFTTTATTSSVSHLNPSGEYRPPLDHICTTPTPQTHTLSQESNSGDTADNMANRKASRARAVESDKSAVQRLQRELFDIKREINAKAAREGVVIAELKAHDVSSIPAPVMIGYNPSEEMRDRLARLEHELAAERKLREEAESVISDIRRECRTPFVVPSLFDAFVDLSKLTTLALRPASPSSYLTEQPVDMSISPKG